MLFKQSVSELFVSIFRLAQFPASNAEKKYIYEI